MWTKAENGEVKRPESKEFSGNNVIVRKNFVRVDATEDIAAHWVYDEWQMTAEQYEVYQYHEQILSEQSDALIELAGLISEVI